MPISLRQSLGRIENGSMSAEHAHVSHQVLAILGADMDDGFTVRRTLRAVSQVADVGEEISPLGRKQVNEV